MNFYAFWADVIVALHVGYVGFVVLSQLLIFVGLIFRWEWIRNFWFRAIHLVLMTIVMVEAASGMTCPLTTWEHQLRVKAGQPIEEASFTGWLFHKVLFYQDVPGWIFRPLHVSFGILVLLTFILARPRWPWKSRAFPQGKHAQQA